MPETTAKLTNRIKVLFSIVEVFFDKKPTFRKSRFLIFWQGPVFWPNPATAAASQCASNRIKPIVQVWARCIASNRIKPHPVHTILLVLFLRSMYEYLGGRLMALIGSAHIQYLDTFQARPAPRPCPASSRCAVSGYSHHPQRGVCKACVEYDRTKYNMQHISSTYLLHTLRKSIRILSGY